MRIGVFGTGTVGRTIGTKLIGLGHEVKMGSRTSDNENAVAWRAGAGEGASHGTYAEAAAFGELLFNCTAGAGSLEAIGSADAADLDGKILVDVANPLDFSKGMPPTLFVAGDDSLAEQIQRTFPGLRVVKSLNTINCEVMVDPSRVPGDHDVFMSGNDADAKAQVEAILHEWFGWEHVIDMGDITTARGTESWLLFWIRLWGVLGTGDFNLHIAH